MRKRGERPSTSALTWMVDYPEFCPIQVIRAGPIFWSAPVGHPVDDISPTMNPFSRCAPRLSASQCPRGPAARRHRDRGWGSGRYGCVAHQGSRSRCFTRDTSRDLDRPAPRARILAAGIPQAEWPNGLPQELTAPNRNVRDIQRRIRATHNA